MSNAKNGNDLAELERRLWAAADQLWANSSLRPSEYSAPVLGLIFLRFVDNSFTKVEAELKGKATGRRTIGKLDYQAISGVMQKIEGVLDRSIATSGYIIKEENQPLGLSKIDFDALRRFFKKAHKRAELERLRAAITAKLQAMIAVNRTRADFLEKFQELIDEYNAGSANVEAIYEQLVKFAQKLNQEEQRHIKEKLTEEELSIFGILTNPRVDITAKEDREVKKVAKDMLQTLKAEKLVLDWRKRQQSRAMVWLCINEFLDKLPQVYTPELYRAKCEAVYQHVYDTYGSGQPFYC